MENKTFKKIISENYKTVQTWPKWKRDIIISAESASTGKYIKEK